MKKILIFTVAALLLLMSCSTTNENSQSNTVEEPGPDSKSSQNSIPRIAVILPVKDYPEDPFAEDVMIGVYKLASEFNGTIHGIQETVEFGNEAEFQIFTTTGGNDSDSVRKIAASLRSFELNTFDLIVGAGFHYSLPFLEIHDDYPDQQFICLDAVIGDFSGTNILGVLFQVTEAAFVAGAAAAERFGGERLAAVGGINLDFINSDFIEPFMAGVEYMDKKMGTNTEVIVDYVGSFGDYEGGYRLAEELYNQNVTCIYQAAGTSGNGILDAARDNGKWVIGVDLDRGLEAALRGDPHEHILTSTQKKWGNGLYLVCKEYLTAGRLPQNSLTVGMAQDCADVSINPYNSIFLGKQLETIRELKSSLMKGTLPEAVRGNREEGIVVWETLEEQSAQVVLIITVNDPVLSPGIPEHYGTMLQEAMSSEFYNSGRYKVIDREQVRRLLSEINFSMEAVSEETDRLEVGRLIAAEAIAFINLGQIGEKYNLDCKLVEVETGLTMGAVRETYPDFESSLEGLGSLIRRLKK